MNLTLYVWKVGNQQVYYIQEICGAIVNQETIKKNAAVLVYGLFVLVDCVILVNGEIIILDVRELCDRNLHNVPQAVAVSAEVCSVKLRSGSLTRVTHGK